MNVFNTISMENRKTHIVSLDASKALDKLWRGGLFFKLIGKVDDVIWRLLFNYYKQSKAFIRDEINSKDPVVISTN